MARAGPPERYRILIEGELDPKWSALLGGLAIAVREEPGKPPVTVLTGCVEDQAALHGAINSLFMLNLRLLLVERQEPTMSEAGQSDERNGIP